VLGSHGHGAIRRFLLGSVADRVFKGAPCAVLVVPPRVLGPALADADAKQELHLSAV
jgi:hypothetical protein